SIVGIEIAAQELDGGREIAAGAVKNFGGVHPYLVVGDFGGGGAVDRVFHVIQAAAAAVEGSQGEPVLRLVAAGLNGGTVFALCRGPVVIPFRQAGVDAVGRSGFRGGWVWR